ncbi:MAG: YbgC/FadM family acyl-CoA thioesterase [Mariprofundaceae bacterium]
MSSFTHIFPTRVYYEDTDHGGVVYHANYLKYLERARTEFLRDEGIELDNFEQETGVLFAVAKAELLFHRPARFNDLLMIESCLLKAKGARLHFEQKVLRKQADSDNESECLLSARIDIASITRSGRPIRLPLQITSICQGDATYE